MAKKVAATEAKNNFGGLLDDVAALGRVDIIKHGRLVAVVLAPRLVPAEEAAGGGSDSWSATHMIHGEQARTARIVRPPRDFDET